VHLAGEQTQPGALVGTDDVPGQHPAQAGGQVVPQPGDNPVRVARGGKRIDQTVGDQSCTGVYAMFDHGSAYTFDVVGVRPRGGQHDGFDPVEVVGQHMPNGVACRLRVGSDAHQHVAGQVDRRWLAASPRRACGDLLPSPANVARAGDGAKLHAVSPGARRLQHAAVDPADIDRDRRPEGRKVEPGVGADGEDLAVDPLLTAQHGANNSDGFDHRRQGFVGAAIGLTQGAQRPQRRPDAQHQPAAAGLVQGRGFHRDQRRMPPERVDDADTDLDVSGCRGQRGCHGEQPPTVATLGQPDFLDPEFLGLDRQRDSRTDGLLVRQGEPETPRGGGLAGAHRQARA
jgi:hypothetical protein